MNNNRFSFSPLFLSSGFAAVRIITGVLMIYHGFEVFDSDKINGYSQWLNDLKFPAPGFMAYLGKGTEFVGGLLLTIGLLTRGAALALAVAMVFVCLIMGSCRFFTDDQHPFLFVLLAAVFFFTGAGKWSLDYVLFRQKNPFI